MEAFEKDKPGDVLEAVGSRTSNDEECTFKHGFTNIYLFMMYMQYN